MATDVMAAAAMRAGAGNVSVVEVEEEQEEVEFLVLVVFMATLLVSQLLLYLSRKLNQSLVPEAGLLLLLGMAIGAIIRASEHGGILTAVGKLTEFDENLFFIVLLPPIIFDSGFTVRRDMFIGNFFVILALAVAGTIISTFVVGICMYATSSSAAGSMYQTTWIESLVFGAIISATDPVTVISVFQSIGVKPALHILVFGESVLNDAVAIVLYRTLVLFEDKALDEDATAPVLSAVAEFAINLFGSAFLGIAIGIGSAILFKWLRLWEVELRELECTVAVTVPYLSYTLAQGVNISGIVSMLFTAIFMASFTRHNLSTEAAKFVAEIFHLLAHMAETFVFIYLGMAVFTGDGTWNTGSIIYGFVAVLACLVARFAAIIPLCTIGNIFRPRSQRISCAEMFMVWFSGLRGGMAFALAASSSNTLSRESTGQVFEAATTIIVFMTVFLFGGSVKMLSNRLDLVDRSAPSPIPSPYADEHQLINQASPSFPKVDSFTANNGTTREGGDLAEVELADLSATTSSSTAASSGEAAQNPFAEAARVSASQDESTGIASRWERFENRFLRPVLIRQSDSDNQRSNTVRDISELEIDAHEDLAHI
ncbi:Sodium/hydrogen exchanger 6 [Hondaea fermentalgiana]|uniref:Sodium/hydrogen exchanger n=1 Tax=Hondaea fermentalgiana TaxID=2315210 RepID=A0A2R5G7Y9_9STRA|nr:Sodium/hydrogen exchanger 6 [Hondaea fermentalgiana]|eukprot:GBG23814.1 Sodium/hydrogen exchanger 6 [Hondaea fermentalgiana]